MRIYFYPPSLQVVSYVPSWNFDFEKFELCDFNAKDGQNRWGEFLLIYFRQWSLIAIIHENGILISQWACSYQALLAVSMNKIAKRVIIASNGSNFFHLK